MQVVNSGEVKTVYLSKNLFTEFTKLIHMVNKELRFSANELRAVILEFHRNKIFFIYIGLDYLSGSSKCNLVFPTNQEEVEQLTELMKNLLVNGY